MLPPPVLCAVLAKLKLVTVHGPWWRVVAFRFLLKKPADPLYAAGSKIDGARFTPKDGFDSLYLTGDQVTALAEVNSLVLLPGGPKSVPIPPCTLFAVEGVVSRVLDLTDAATLAALGTDEQEMTGPYNSNMHPICSPYAPGDEGRKGSTSRPVDQLVGCGTLVIRVGS